MFNTITHQQFLLLIKAFLKSLVGKKPVISQQEYDIFVINTRPRVITKISYSCCDITYTYKTISLLCISYTPEQVWYPCYYTRPS